MLVPNDATVDVLNALSIHCIDGTNGNYLIYDQANYLLNTVDNKIVRSMQLYFNSKTYGTENNNENERSIMVVAKKQYDVFCFRRIDFNRL